MFCGAAFCKCKVCGIALYRCKFYRILVCFCTFCHILFSRCTLGCFVSSTISVFGFGSGIVELYISFCRIAFVIWTHGCKVSVDNLSSALVSALATNYSLYVGYVGNFVRSKNTVSRRPFLSMGNVFGNTWVIWMDPFHGTSIYCKYQSPVDPQKRWSLVYDRCKYSVRSVSSFIHGGPFLRDRFCNVVLLLNSAQKRLLAL